MAASDRTAGGGARLDLAEQLIDETPTRLPARSSATMAPAFRGAPTFSGPETPLRTISSAKTIPPEAWHRP